MTPIPAVEYRGITKAFAGVPVLRGVNFSIPAGHTLGLVGENGAGKSTLMNLLGGNFSPDSGELRMHGQLYAPRSPMDATRQGIAFIHQELNLFGNLSIAENLFITSFPSKAGLLIDRATARQRARELLDQVGLHASPDTLVENLSAGERQLVEIAKGLGIDARVMIFDEPTTSLSAREAKHLFELLENLRARGVSMIYISHTLEDVMRLCDDIVVLRDGEVVGAGPKSEFSVERLISLMVGRTLNQLFPSRQGTPGSAVVLEARRLTHPGIVRDIDFQLHAGEVLGIFGLMGAGRSELARILFGLDRCEQGEVLLEGKPLRSQSIAGRIARGLAFLTENRRQEGLFLNGSIADNMALVSLRRNTRTPLRLVNGAAVREAITSIRQAVRLTPSAGNDRPVKILSGGNQQKVVLAKWLLAQPKAFILDEPTRGIDVGAKYEVYQLIHQLADGGAGALVISSELEELLGICDRILVMNRGAVKDDLPRKEFERERILRAALHHNAAPS